jgi:hypothetical protein
MPTEQRTSLGIRGRGQEFGYNFHHRQIYALENAALREMEKRSRICVALILIAIVIISSVAINAFVLNGSPNLTLADKLSLDSNDLGKGWRVGPDPGLQNINSLEYQNGTGWIAIPNQNSVAAHDAFNETNQLYLIVSVYDSVAHCREVYERSNNSITVEGSHHTPLEIGDHGFLFWMNGANYSTSWPNIEFMKGNVLCTVGSIVPLNAPYHNNWDLDTVMKVAQLQASKINSN